MHVSLDAIAEREVFPGFHGRFVHGDTVTLVYWTIEIGRNLPSHSHPHEQVVNVLDGVFELVVDGEVHTLRAGDVFAIAGNRVHSGRAVTECRILDVFSPVREDYRTT
jgi:quercetin dioxygenase-like cupin family protein